MSQVVNTPRQFPQPRHLLITTPHFFQPLPLWIWVSTALFICFGLLTANPEVTIACNVTLLLVTALLWSQVESPVLLFALAIQWLQVATPVFHSDFQGKVLTDLYRAPHIIQATWLSLIGIVVLAIGIRLSWLGMRNEHERAARLKVKELDPLRLFVAWLAALGLAIVVGLVAWFVPGLAQLIYGLSTVKWVLLFILAYRTLSLDTNYQFLLAALTIEFVIGFAGFFANWLAVFLLLSQVAFCTHIKLRKHQAFFLSAALILAILSSILWTAVKMKYRNFLNRGTGQQTVSVPIKERFLKLNELSSGLTIAEVDRGIEALIYRVGYTELFARTIAYVPRRVPHENGKLWRGAVLHVLQPRLLFPNKEALNDSDRTFRYTGIGVAGSSQGTSIGIGYMAESYVDFGPYYMFVPIFLLGLTYGFVYRYFVSSNPSHLLGTAIATAILFIAWQGFATANAKIVGGLITQCVLMFLLNWLYGFRLMNWLRGAHVGRIYMNLEHR